MGYLDIEGDPNEVAGSAARLTAAGNALGTRLATSRADVAAIEGEQPWGSDKYGQEFLKGYHQPMTDGTTFQTAVEQSTASLPDGLTTLGDATTWAVLGYQDADATVAHDINRL